MEPTSIFMTAPDAVNIAHTAAKEWARFVDGRTQAAAQQELIAYHLKHVQKMVNTGELSEQMGCVLITDVPGFDLAVIDAHFPSLKERRVELFTRRGVQIVLGLLNRPLRTIPLH